MRKNDPLAPVYNFRNDRSHAVRGNKKMAWGRKARQAGFTLIELLLYVGLIGILLSSVSYFVAMTTDARVKNQTIAEVDEQGEALMDTITQTVRNATAITSPAAAGSGSSLTVTVPTGSLSPTVFDIAGGSSSVLGYNADGGTTDSGAPNSMDATKFTAGSSGTVSTLYALVGPTVAVSPNDKGQMAIYSGTTSPSTLLANSGDVTLTANSWVSFPISSVSITSGQTYWLAYNTNGLTNSDNNLRYHVGASGSEVFTGRTYGTWPASWTGTSSTAILSVYANVTTGSSTGAAEIKEGANAAVPLTNSRVQVTSLAFKNLTRTGTPGVVQISFTIARLNPNGRNEYDYQKTFTDSAEISW